MVEPKVPSIPLKVVENENYDPSEKAPDSEEPTFWGQGQLTSNPKLV
jgi:hypothetical protein